MHRVVTRDGRALEVLTSGPPGSQPLVYHSGTPGAAVPMPLLEQAAAGAGAQVITWSRPVTPARPSSRDALSVMWPPMRWPFWTP